jgi:Flp pilus assembly protein TadG
LNKLTKGSYTASVLVMRRLSNIAAGGKHQVSLIAPFQALAMQYLVVQENIHKDTNVVLSAAANFSDFFYLTPAS